MTTTECIDREKYSEESKEFTNLNESLYLKQISKPQFPKLLLESTGRLETMLANNENVAQKIQIPMNNEQIHIKNVGLTIAISEQCFAVNNIV
ncbi:hypothetical protein AAEX28_13645 [Lentisphaerota bacterium WC36G]|nr:hypothetical protein LJT99_00400 [Lentisphaerae bacterium WC36]